MRLRPSVRPSDGRSVTWFFLVPIMKGFLHESNRGGPTMALLNMLICALGVVDVLNVRNVLKVLNMPKDTSLATWALSDFDSIWFGS